MERFRQVKKMRHDRRVSDRIIHGLPTLEAIQEKYAAWLDQAPGFEHTIKLQEGGSSIFRPISNGDSLDPIRLLFNDIGNIPLLEKEEVTTLSKIRITGMQAAKRLQKPLVSHDKKLDLERKSKGVLARKIMVVANLRLIAGVAKRYIDRGLAYGELINEGVFGLNTAAGYYDWKYGVTFATYATWWIRQSITHALRDKNRTVRVPIHAGHEMARLRKIEQQLFQELGRDPTSEELAEAMEMRSRKIRTLQRASLIPISLNAPAGEDEDDEVIDFIRSEQVLPEYEVDFKMFQEELTLSLGVLTERENKIVRLRYGLDDGQRWTLEEIVGEMDVTRERVRQIQAEAIEKLARNPRLQSYFPGYENDEPFVEDVRRHLRAWKQLCDEVYLPRPQNIQEVRDAGVELLRDVFYGLDEEKTSQIFTNWLTAVDKGLDPFIRRGRITRGLTAEQRISSVVLGLGDLRSLLPQSPLGSVIRELKKNYVGRPEGFMFGQTMLLLLVSAQQEYDSKYRPLFTNVRELEDSVVYLERYAERLIARLVVEDLESGLYKYQSVEPRAIPILRLFIAGKTSRQILEELGYPDSESARKNVGRFFHQFSFGRPTRTPSFTQEIFIRTYGIVGFIAKVDEFVSLLSTSKPEFIRGQSPGYNRWSICTAFARRWHTGSKTEIVPLLLERGGANKLAEKLDVSPTLINVFRRCFQNFLLDGLTLPEIFSNNIEGSMSRKKGGFASLQQAYSVFSETLGYINKNQLLGEILPARSSLLNKYMGNFIQVISEGVTGIDLFVEISRRMNFELSYVYLLNARSALFCDLLKRVKSFPRRDWWCNPISEAWSILALADYIEEKKMTKQTTSHRIYP